MMISRIKDYLKQLYIIYKIKRSGLFDKEYYLRNNLDIARSCVNPVKHYVRHGWRDGLNPNKYFDTKWYLKTYCDVKNTGMNPFYHYIKFGITENRKPSLNYSTSDIYPDLSRVSHLRHPLSQIPFQLLGVLESSLNNRYTEKKVSIIIPVYNAYEYLQKLLQLIYMNSDINFEIIAVDDKSTDTRIFHLLKEYSQQNSNFRYLQNSENLGFVRTVNRAIKSTADTDVLIINTDVEIPEKWLSRIFHPIWSGTAVASVTPMSNSASIMSFPDFGNNQELFEGMSLKQIDDEFQKLNPDKDIYVETPTGHGFCMAMSRQAIEQIGLFDEDAFGKGYGEENDWCMKAKKKGFRNLIATNIFVVHHHSKSFGNETREKYVEKQLRIIHKRYPSYRSDLKKVMKNPQYRYIRELLLFILLAKCSKRTVLRFEHVNSGGSAFACADYIAENRADTLCLIIRPVVANKYILNIFYRNYEHAFDIDSESQIYQLFDLIKVNKIIINQLVGYESLKEIHSIIRKIKLNYNPEVVINIRDFFSVCPRYTLMYKDKEFCNLDRPEKECSDCYCTISNFQSYKLNFSKINLWRMLWLDLLKCVDSIVVFSNFTKSILIKTYPEIEAKIQKSDIPINYLRKVNMFKHGDKLNIAVIGNINYHKGSTVVLELVRFAKKAKNKHIRFFLFGKTNNYELKHDVIDKGMFQREDLPNLMEKNEIDIIFIPSICAETFGRTVQEAIEMDMPVATFNIGAPPERLFGYDKGLIIDRIDAKYALECILEFIEKIRWSDISTVDKSKHISPQLERVRRYNAQKGTRQAKVVVYTAITNNYDSLMIPDYITDDWDYICFSDNDIPGESIYEIRTFECPDLDDRRKIRKVKTMPHLYLSDYEYSIWIDANIKICGPHLENTVIECMKRGDRFLGCPHPEKRSSIYDELAACITLKKDDPAIMIQQVARYSKEGLDEISGILAGGLILRNHNSLDIIALDESWWKEIQQGSYRDQLSLMYVLWKQRLRYEVIPDLENIREHSDYFILPHSRNNLRNR